MRIPRTLLFFSLLAVPKAFSQTCQITSPLPIPISIQGCTYNSNLPGGSTSYIQNSSSLQSGATAYPDFLYVRSSETVPTLNVTGLTSGMCVQAGTNGLLTSAASACGSGSGGGASVYPATATIVAPFGVSATTVTIGDVPLASVFDNTDGVPAETLVIMPTIANAHMIKFLWADSTNALNFDYENKRFGFFTATPASGVEINNNIKVDGTIRVESGIRVPTTSGIFSFQGTATLASGSAVVANAIIDNTWSLYLTIQSPSGTPGSVYVSSITANTSFNVLSTSGSDNSTFSWLMIQH